VPVENARRIKVYFNADRSLSLPWSFRPQQTYVSVLPGESSLAFYTAKNNSKEDIIGIATYNVTPDRVCLLFCFSIILCRGIDDHEFRLRHIFPKWSASVLRSRNYLRARR
jgi:cytochrome c oxidase assembly protein Cox11